MKSLMTLLAVATALAANAAMWEGVADENHVCGPKVTERDLLGKAVLVFYYSQSEQVDKRAARFEELWKSHDKKRFAVIGSVASKNAASVAAVAKLKLTFPVYKDFQLASDPDKGKRTGGTILLVSHYGKMLISGQMSRDAEEFIVNAIAAVGMPPDLISGVTLDKYKSLKNSLKLGKSLKSVTKQLEKDVAAGEKKIASAAVKAKAEEASSILSAIRDGKSDISDSINLLAESNPAEAYRLLSLYLKSFPDEAADNKSRLDELKAKAAEFKKQAK